MDGFHVTPEALLTYAEGNKSLAEKFDQLSRLLEQAKVDDKCFGSLGDAVGLSSSYFEALDECREIATSASRYLSRNTDSLHQTFAICKGIDTGLSQGFTAFGEGLGGGGA